MGMYPVHIAPLLLHKLLLQWAENFLRPIQDHTHLELSQVVVRYLHVYTYEFQKVEIH